MSLTILIPVYNTPPEHLFEAVYSILRQDYEGKPRIILVNDGSTSVEALTGINGLSNHPRVFIETVNHGGTAKALNAGHALIDTEFVAIMGSDDIAHPARLRLQMEYVKRHPQVDVLGTNLYAFYSDDFYRAQSFTTSHTEIPRPPKDNSSWYVNHGTVVYRQKSVMDAGGYNEQKGRGQDIELWERMAKRGCIFRNVTQVLYGWRRFRK